MRKLVQQLFILTHFWVQQAKDNSAEVVKDKLNSMNYLQVTVFENFKVV